MHCRHVKFDGVAVELLVLHFLFSIHFGLVVELHAPELDWRCTLLKCRSEIDVFRNDATIQERDHALIYIVLRNRWRILQFLLFLQEHSLPGVTLLLLLHNRCHRLLGLVWPIFVVV